MTDGRHPASFRDPSGHVFRRDGILLRQVNRGYASEYDQLMGSGLYERLTHQRWLIPHEEIETAGSEDDAAHFKTLRPEPVDFISYPYEWCFSQLRDAALLTLRIQREALAHDMTLRDASAYNVQFHRGSPVFIDTLSFGHYTDGEPWVGYRQFCQHFLAPLALMSRRDVRLQQLLISHIDGIPLDLAVSLLPRSSWLNLGLTMHLWMHARFQRRFEAAGSGASTPPPARKLTRSAQLNMLQALEGTVRKLDWQPEGTEWADYGNADSYDEAALDFKQGVVQQMLAAIGPKTVWDLGANTGRYSRIASLAGARVCSFDVDPACVELNYRQARKEQDEMLLPLRLDLVNPSPGIGWSNRERATLAERSNADAILALALIHHLAISNNVPLSDLSQFFARLAPQLVVEFVPKSDPKVATLLATRDDIFPDYTRAGFEAAFANDWKLVESTEIEGSERTLYRCERLRTPAD